MAIRKILLGCITIIVSAAPLSCVSYEEKDVSGGAERYPGGYQTLAFQPMIVSQCTTIAGTSFFIKRGKDSCIAELTSYDHPACEGKGEFISPDQTLQKNRLFIGPLDGNRICPETVTVSRGSPCYLVEFDSGGTHYKMCYHDNKKVDLNWCVNHTGKCGPPHNP